MEKKPKLIHVACIQEKNIGFVYLFLRQVNSGHYVWFKEEPASQEKETPISGATVEEAIQRARQFWKDNFFRTLICGFRYTLPERDEHGYNALFHQMVASYASMNGVYFDDELGHNCIVYNASNEARSLSEKLQQTAQL
jgi:hypothetical protein